VPERSKNDATDAQAIFEAAGRPTMRFVPVKSVECQDLQALHRIRDRLVHSRTSSINHTRGLLAEYGVVLPQGAKRFTAQVGQVVAEADLSDLARELFSELLDQLGDANHYLRRQIMHGARAVGRWSDPRAEWMKGGAARRGFNRAVIAVANKMARAAWAMLVREETYAPA